MANQQQNLLRKFPPEIRDLIFTPCLLFSHKDDPAPTLLAALRPDGKLYEEALDIFYKMNEFFFDIHHGAQFEGLKIDIIQRIQSLQIRYGHRLEGEKEMYLAKVHLATGLKSLSLRLEHWDGIADLILKMCMECYTNLQTLRFTIIGYSLYDQRMVKQLERKIEIEGKRGRDPDNLECLTWEAGDGATIFSPESP